MDYIILKEQVQKFRRNMEAERKSPNTVSTYNVALNGLLEYAAENTEGDFEFKELVFDYIDNLSADLKPSSINIKRSAIRSFVTFLKERGAIDEDFSSYIKSIRNNKKKKDILEPKEIKQLLNHLSNELKEASGYNVYHKARNLTMVVFMLYTATRRGEVVKVKFSDIDFINNEIKVLGKGDKERIIPLKAELKESLYNFRDIIEKLHIADYNVKSDYLFRSERVNPATQEKDSPMTPRNVLLIVKKACKKAGIEKNITAHSLRHIFASYAIQNNMNIRALSDILGHSSTSITLDIYSHIISNEIKQSEMGKLEY
ncbi:tyrosine-type recombinase/integrase [Gudongella sp. DL1XJH-153]|uniref:tyrosine-type recombinase/integrase n=1 Tax=Gudongella sp. DL1XJH-153 TaxID=3409804 RepID=UPI003BB5DF79